MLGIEIDQNYEASLKRSIEASAEHRRQRKLEKQMNEQRVLDELTQCFDAFGWPDTA